MTNVNETMAGKSRIERSTYMRAYADFTDGTGRDSVDWVRELRQRAMGKFAQDGFPTRKQEAWKYTDLAPLAQTRFATPGTQRGDAATWGEALGPLPTWENETRLVFVNGQYAASLSTTSALPGDALARSLAQCHDSHAALLQSIIAPTSEPTEKTFTLLNTSFLHDGAFVLLPRGTAVPGPIHLVFAHVGERAISSHPRIVIVAEENSEATVVETHVGSATAPCFANPVTQVSLGVGARLRYCKLQPPTAATSFHIGDLRVSQEADSSFAAQTLMLGGNLVRNDAEIALRGRGAECTLSGVFVTGDHEHVDNYTLIDHASPHARSNQLYKGVLDSHATGAFSGKILVREGADGTDARQSNPNLLLSPKATMNTKPQLEIFADDVKCAHGATIGQLDPEATFYLQARGIPAAEARRLLIAGFVGEVIDQVPVEALRTEAKRVLGRRLEV